MEENKLNKKRKFISTTVSNKIIFFYLFYYFKGLLSNYLWFYFILDGKKS